MSSMVFAMDGVLGLRDRKKRETRQRISNAATMLFLTRGFDNVTVAEIAETANVSKMTVFNYFPRKEDMFFDRQAEAIELMERAVADRPPGESVCTALRRLLLELAAARHPLGGLRDGLTAFWQLVLDSPALRTAVLENIDQLERQLTRLLAETVKAGPPPELAAAMLIAVWRTSYLASARRLMAGERADDIYPDHVALVNNACDRVDRALGDYGAQPSCTKIT